MSEDKYEAEFQRIYSVMESGDFPAALKALVKLEEAGEAKAAYLLGYMYFTGKGAERSREIAVSYLKKSAKQGFIPAIKLLSSIDKPKTVTDNAEVARLKKEADKGDAPSAYKYAMLLMRGDGTAKNKDEAVRYFTSAAEKGHFLSMIALFNRYSLDRDYEPQWSRAYYWFRQAREADSERLNIVHPNIIRGEELYFEGGRDDLPADERRKKLEQAIKEGFFGAYSLLGDLCDGDAAIQAYKEGAAHGDCDAITRLVRSYTDGIYTEKDANNAAFWQNEYERLSPFIGK